jgi:hypothetical protein
MDRSDFDDDLRYCPSCRDYVRYLRSLEQSYCAECGGRVHLFARDDLARLREGITRDSSDSADDAVEGL